MRSSPPLFDVPTVQRASLDAAAVKALPPAIMVQGVCSNAGKSLLATALCRLLARRGLKVAPFKAQNMSLNSFVTMNNEEIGRAQALQAAACGREPDARMNPVLLKPTSHTGSQIMLLGQPAGFVRAAEFAQFKARAWAVVRRAYCALAGEVDVMVLEGAGSPAEINLKAHDIVNMRMARYAGAHVLLVADIDRGGAFAALMGTMQLLTRSERARVAGFLLNKFRGDASLLAPAPEIISRRTGKPFFGVVPMLENLRLPEEDSVSFKFGPRWEAVGHTDVGQAYAGPNGVNANDTAQILDIALVDLPHISNFTDADALRHEPNVRVRVVRRPEDWGQPHAVIVPGSKNSVADLRFLKATGLDVLLRSCSADGGPVLVGICGGLQMLGLRIDDPLNLEEGGTEPGLGLLPLHTELGAEKELRRVTGHAAGILTGNGVESFVVQGYEIHHGISWPEIEETATSGMSNLPIMPIIKDADGRILGWGRIDASGQLRIWGTYLHGVFDADAFRHAFLRELRTRAGLMQCAGLAYSLGPELDRLADTVEAHVDMPAIYALLGL